MAPLDSTIESTKLRKPCPDTRSSHPSSAERLPPDFSGLNENGILLRPPPIGASRSSTPDSFISRPGTPASFTSSAGSVRVDGDRQPASVDSPLEKEKKKHRSWLGRNKHEKKGDHGPAAWTLGDQEKVPYDVGDLLHRQPVPDMWDNTGDCLVYLPSNETGKSPSFRMHSSILASSRMLTEHIDSEGRLHIPRGHAMASGKYDPTNHTETLVAIRNLFAMLTGRPLVATQRRPSAFDIFMEMSRLLTSFEFSNIDGSTYGEVALSGFDYYVDELGLADVRISREKTIEGLVLGERMKSVKLYNEAFTHAVGKHHAVVKFGSPKFDLISQVSINRLSRAALDLEKHAITVSQVLGDLEFPSIFSGIMTSKTASERKHVDFDEWRSSFLAARKFFLGFYKQRFKHWPPKPISKHGVGLNRLVLQEVYQDLCSLYDLIVDRSSLTHRIDSGPPPDAAAEPRASAILQIFGEYDRSSPPVKPPIPYDLPDIPSIKTILPDFGTNEKKDAKAISRNLKDDEISKVLRGRHGEEPITTKFLEAFVSFEQKRAHSKNIKVIADHRIGHFMFLYAVLQILPLVVIDAPAIRYVSGVEYFLSQPPRSGVPWAREGSKRHDDPSRGDTARLPADMTEPGIEGVYHRSHCWIMAERWKSPRQVPLRPRAAARPPPTAAVSERQAGHKARNFSRGGSSADMPGSRPASSLYSTDSHGQGQKNRPLSAQDPAKTFDAILADGSQGKKGKRK